MQLDEQDRAYVLTLVQAQDKPKVVAGVANPTFFHARPVNEARFLGLCAKYATASLFKLTYEPKARLTGKIDGEPDFVLTDGRTVEVRWRERSYYDFALKSDNPHDLKTDIAILALSQEINSIRIAGWVTREQFLERYYVQDWGWGPRCAIKQADMEPMNLLAPGYFP